MIYSKFEVHFLQLGAPYCILDIHSHYWQMGKIVSPISILDKYVPQHMVWCGFATLHIRQQAGVRLEQMQVLARTLTKVIDRNPVRHVYTALHMCMITICLKLFIYISMYYILSGVGTGGWGLTWWRHDATRHPCLPCGK